MNDFRQHKEFDTFNNLKKANAVRRQLGLTLLKEKSRSCLRCNLMFLSEGSHHRMCKTCRSYGLNQFCE